MDHPQFSESRKRGSASGSAEGGEPSDRGPGAVPPEKPFFYESSPIVLAQETRQKQRECRGRRALCLGRRGLCPRKNLFAMSHPQLFWRRNRVKSSGSAEGGEPSDWGLGGWGPRRNLF